jgi:hypothetical protein
LWRLLLLFWEVLQITAEKGKGCFFSIRYCALQLYQLFFIEQGMLLEGFILIVLANIVWRRSCFYNSFLPEITGENIRSKYLPGDML